MNERKSVLIVDKNASLMKIYRFFLERAGYDVTFLVYSGDPFEVENKKFDVAVVDDLRGAWSTVWNQITAGRKMLYCGSQDAVHEARERKCEAHLQGKEIKKRR